MISKILGLFVITLTADEMYSLRNSENLLPSIQMQLSKRQIFFWQSWAPFVNSESNFEHFETKMTVIAYVSPKLRTAKDVVR